MSTVVIDPEAQNADIEETQQPEDSTEEQLPEKFKGKSAKDIANSYSELESEVGRTRNELGQVRRLADELLGIRKAELQANQSNKNQPTKITTETLLDRPDETITEIARREADARTADVAERTTALESELRLAKFERQFPDYEATANDDGFKGWVRKSPYRARLAQTAANGDFEAAEELFGLYKETKQDSTEEKPQKDNGARKAALAKSGGSSAAGVGSTASSGKEILKRSDLINLRIKDPEEFDRRWPEIEAAYREKRVR